MTSESEKTYIFNPPGKDSNTIQPRPASVKLTWDGAAAGEARRNTKQLAAIPKYESLKSIYDDKPGSTLKEMFGESLNWAYRCYGVHLDHNVTLSGLPIFQKYIYLFNVLIAFEWEPSVYNVSMLERAARRAADFLFDVTNGWMTFGQVVIGGPELLGCADFQVMASNRLLPRSWVGGLHEEKKYMPIRVGRGLWQKNSRGSIPWDEPEGYRVLIHEWAHYALELLDDYIDMHQVYIPEDILATQGPNEARRSKLNLVVPTISPPVESIMSTLEGTSELTAKRGNNLNQRKRAEWDAIIEGFEGREGKKIPRFPHIKEPPKPIEGPLPLPQLPHFAKVILAGDSTNWRPELLLPFASIPLSIKPEHCWVYILKGLDVEGIPKRILAQGSLDALSEDGFRLFGAEKGDHIMLIGNASNWGEKVLRAEIGALAEIGASDEKGGSDEGKRFKIDKLTWVDVTPKPFPIIVVQPEKVVSPEDRTVAIRVRVYMNYKQDGNGKVEAAPYEGARVAIFPLDQVAITGATDKARIDLTGDKTTETPVSLDGHVFVKLGETYIIATYSQGGGPPTGSPVGGTPMSPGSSEGNLMIFFADQGEYPDQNVHHGEIRIITTRWPGGAPSSLVDSGASARSYAYTLCSNGALPSEYLPTLSLFYDKRAEIEDGEAIIHRLDYDNDWKEIISYRPIGGWYVAAPLDIVTAPRLFDADVPEDEPRVEHFRLYWMPRDAVDKKAVSG